MFDVLLVGEAMGLFIAEEYGEFEDLNSFSKGIAGAEINVATGLARLGYDVSYVSKLGEDPFGYYIEKHLQKENIHTDHVIFDSDRKTGLQIKNKVKDIDPKVAYYRKGSAFSTLNKEDVETIDFSKIKLFHITGVPLALNTRTREVIFYLAEKAKEQGCIITFDPNLRPSLWESEEKMIHVLNEIAKYADVILPGVEEGRILTGRESIEEIAEFYIEFGMEAVIIKNGSQGAYVLEQNKKGRYIPGYKVKEVVDTVGAGDGFSAGVISGLLDKVSIVDAAKRGNAIGSLQVQHKSDNEGLPRKDELEKYMTSDSESSIS